MDSKDLLLLFQDHIDWKPYALSKDYVDKDISEVVSDNHAQRKQVKQENKDKTYAETNANSTLIADKAIGAQQKVVHDASEQIDKIDKLSKEIELMKQEQTNQAAWRQQIESDLQSSKQSLVEVQKQITLNTNVVANICKTISNIMKLAIENNNNTCIFQIADMLQGMGVIPTGKRPLENTNDMSHDSNKENMGI